MHMLKIWEIIILFITTNRLSDRDNKMGCYQNN